MLEDIPKKFKDSLVSSGYTEYVAAFFAEQVARVCSLVSELNKVCSDVQLDLHFKD